ERDLVAVGVAVGHLAHAVSVRLALVGLESAAGDLGQLRVEVVDEEHDHAVPRALGSFDDVDGALPGERPHGLGVVREERRLAEERLVPPAGGGEVADAQAGEEVQAHGSQRTAHPAGSAAATARAAVTRPGAGSRQASAAETSIVPAATA